MGTPYCCTVLVHQYGRRKSKKTSGEYDKHPLELGGLQQKCPPWEVWIFFGTIQGGLPWHLERFL